MEGQMLPAERQFLYDCVTAARPQLVLEVGTWKGGGSTWQIANAVLQLRTAGSRAQFHTCEPDPELFQEAFAIYAGSPWNEFVRCHELPSTRLITRLSNVGLHPDFVFFDGPEDEDTALNDFRALDPVLRVGTKFMMHDWDLGIRVDGLHSTKAVKIRPYLEKLPTWRIVRALTAPDSVGLVLAEKIG